MCSNHTFRNLMITPMKSPTRGWRCSHGKRDGRCVSVERSYYVVSRQLQDLEHELGHPVHANPCRSPSPTRRLFLMGQAILAGLHSSNPAREIAGGVTHPIALAHRSRWPAACCPALASMGDPAVFECFTCRCCLPADAGAQWRNDAASPVCRSNWSLPPHWFQAACQVALPDTHAGRRAGHQPMQLACDMVITPSNAPHAACLSPPCCVRRQAPDRRHSMSAIMMVRRPGVALIDPKPRGSIRPRGVQTADLCALSLQSRMATAVKRAERHRCRPRVRFKQIPS